MRVVHFLNQFFGGLGGEEKAGVAPALRDGPLGPGKALEAASGGELVVVGTVTCGDNYFSERTSEAIAAAVALIAGLKPEVVVAGPSFNAGRYSLACGEVCKAVQAQLGIPAVSGMYEETPGVAAARSGVVIARTSETAAGMREAIAVMARLALKRGRGEELGLPAVEGYFPRGLRRNSFDPQTGAARAVAMVLKKYRGEPFETEVPRPDFDRVPSPPPVPSVKTATIALATEAGVVPKGNPDQFPWGWCTRWSRYPVKDLDDLTSESHEMIHYGGTTRYCNQDPDRMVPLDVMRQLEREGRVGQVADHYWMTVGGGTTMDNATRMAREMAEDLKASGVQGVIFTAT